MILFKPRVGKVIFAQTTGGFSVIIPLNKYISLSIYSKYINILSVFFFFKSKANANRKDKKTKRFSLVCMVKILTHHLNTITRYSITNHLSLKNLQVAPWYVWQYNLVRVFILKLKILTFMWDPLTEHGVCSQFGYPHDGKTPDPFHLFYSLRPSNFFQPIFLVYHGCSKYKWH